ncbi:MAG: acyl-CoA thioesterase domain-containing protein, partial [Pseudomonadota bacterium]
MSGEAVRTLLSVLDIERLELNLFRGRGEGGETVKRIFGGQVIAQALAAAYQTVEDRPCHSLHAYFIRPGDPSIPVIYEVDRSRDGGSFTTRRVIAVQHGKQILNLAASFHGEEPGWDHQHDMPETPPPKDFPSRAEVRAAVSDRIPKETREQFLRPRPIEIREVDAVDLFAPEPTSDRNRMWFRLRERVEAEPWRHHCLMAYASDMSLLGSGIRPHGLSWMSGRVMAASLGSLRV